ncbi:PAS domain-containing protein [Piscinibacter sp.]|jgi:PAS domain-containing protein|uniref:PAS domain-containing protein n=1 Tax=Piscinibacter sp. TaxID=1903157 RepID=UPI00355AB21A
MRQHESWADAKALRQFFDHLSDAVLLLDPRARITFANTAALRCLPCETGMPLAQLRALLGDTALQWVQQRVGAAVGVDRPGAPALAVTLPDGRAAQLVWQVLDATHSALCMQFAPAPAADTAPASLCTDLSDPGVAELVRVFWKSPFPATLQDSDYRIVDVNAAYLEFSGYTRERLIGIDPLEPQPKEDRDANRVARPRPAAGTNG